MATTYRSYEIEPHRNGGFTWKDERGFTHYFENATKSPYRSEEDAMNDIDVYRKRMRAAQG